MIRPPYLDLQDPRAHRRNLALMIQMQQRGVLSTVGTVTLAVAPATFTDVVHSLVRVGITEVFLQPTSASAAAAVRSSDVWPEISDTIGNGTFRIHHASDAATDRDFAFVLLGG